MVLQILNSGSVVCILIYFLRSRVACSYSLMEFYHLSCLICIRDYMNREDDVVRKFL
jgi:hypothetical protein